jgi:hypothetical protein
LVQRCERTRRRGREVGFLSSEERNPIYEAERIGDNREWRC